MRFTPTHVGKTRAPSRSCPLCPVHPHTRGEDDIAGIWTIGYGGSPPHTWGRLLSAPVSFPVSWFTPTHVGKTVAHSVVSPVRAVHPHTRGEDGDTFTAANPRNGSPPHTWGRPCRLRQGVACGRFTPTHVGKTSTLTRRSRASTVHPHTRGEDFSDSPFAKFLCGSPPHTWGRRPRRSPPAPRVRFTPTHVGKTLGGRTPRRAAPVHPHTRGEDPRNVNGYFNFRSELTFYGMVVLLLKGLERDLTPPGPRILDPSCCTGGTRNLERSSSTRLVTQYPPERPLAPFPTTHRVLERWGFQ